MFTKRETVDLGSITGALTTNSKAIDINNFVGFSCHVIPSGTLAGTVKLQASNNNINWVDIAGASQALAGSTALAFNLPDMYHGLMRVNIVSTAGTSTVTFNVLGKEY
jgi:hypothetical protein